ncbi:MAG: hypothetical protein M1838_002974 [Thelocarpon superellum]|nr:MAG: hypothetical protein M1838_002974 [Thelocarpon superellum]
MPLKRRSCPGGPGGPTTHAAHAAHAANPIQASSTREASRPSRPHLDGAELFAFRPSRHSHDLVDDNATDATGLFEDISEGLGLAGSSPSAPCRPGLTSSSTDSSTSKASSTSAGQRSLTRKLASVWKASPATEAHASSTPTRPPSASSLSSPDKVSPDAMPTLTGDRPSDGHEDKGAGLSSWFRGTSAPVNLGVAVKEEAGVDGAAPLPAIEPIRRSPKSTSPASASRFSFFAAKSTPSLVTCSSDEEVLSLDLRATLYPSGPPSLLSAASFRELQANAEAVVQRVQAAYRNQKRALEELSREKEALQEEKEEAATKSRHLKMQLEHMAGQASDHESTIRDLLAELTLEKQQRQEEREARRRSVALVKHSRIARSSMAAPPPRDRAGTGTGTGTGRKRHSNATLPSDSGFDSEDESSVESVFSRAQGTTSPTGTLCSSTTRTTSPEPDHPWQMSSPTTLTTATAITGAAPTRPSPTPRDSTFARVLKVISTKDKDTEPLNIDTASSAPTVLTKSPKSSAELQRENKALKERLAMLEGTIEGCLNVVGGL